MTAAPTPTPPMARALEPRIYSYIVYEGRLYAQDKPGGISVSLPMNATFDVITSDKPDLMLAEALAILDRNSHQ